MMPDILRHVPRKGENLMSAKKNVKKIVEFLAIKSAKMACGTASTNDFCQTKEPENLKKYFSKR